MQRFLSIFGEQKCKIIGMIHVDALPGKAVRNAAANKRIFALILIEQNTNIKARLAMPAIGNRALRRPSTKRSCTRNTKW